MMTGPEQVSMVRQLQQQLKELSQATNKKYDHMEEVKRRSASDSVLVKARIANIEKNLKNSGGAVPVPVPMGNAITNKNTIKKSENNNPNQSKPLRREQSVPRELLDVEEEDYNQRPKSASTASTTKASINPAIRNTYAAKLDTDRTEHVLRPSLARSIPTYKQVTETHLKSQNKLTVKLVGSSVVKAKANTAN